MLENSNVRAVCLHFMVRNPWVVRAILSIDNTICTVSSLHLVRIYSCFEINFRIMFGQDGVAVLPPLEKSTPLRIAAS